MTTHDTCMTMWLAVWCGAPSSLLMLSLCGGSWWRAALEILMAASVNHDMVNENHILVN